MIGKSFIKHSIIYTVAGALPMASALILLPFYLKYLPTESYGAFAICLSFASLIQILTTYSFDSALYIYFHELKNDRPRLSQVVSSSFSFMAGLGILLVIVSWLAGHYLFSLFASKSSISFFPYGFVSVGIGIFQSLFKVHGNLLQTREKPTPYFWSNMTVFAIIAVTTIVGLLQFPNSLLGPLGGRLIAFGVAAIWALSRVYREFGFHISSPWQNTSRGFNAFTFIYQLQQWIINYFDRFIILLFMPVAALASVGIYDFAVKCLVPIELLLNGLNAAIFPNVIKHLTGQAGEKEATPEINRYFYGQVSVIVLAVTSSILVLPWVLSFFPLKSGYLAALEYIPYLAPLFILRSVRLYFVLPLNILKKSQQLTLASMCIAAFKVLTMYWAISRFGILGLIAASGVAYAAEIVLLWSTLRNYYKIKFNALKLMISPFAILILAVLLPAMAPEGFDGWIRLFLFLLSVVLLVVAYRKELPLLKSLKPNI